MRSCPCGTMNGRPDSCRRGRAHLRNRRFPGARSRYGRRAAGRLSGGALGGSLRIRAGFQLQLAPARARKCWSKAARGEWCVHRVKRTKIWLKERRRERRFAALSDRQISSAQTVSPEERAGWFAGVVRHVPYALSWLTETEPARAHSKTHCRASCECSPPVEADCPSAAG